MRRPAAAHELDSGWWHIYGGKNQILNLAFIYTLPKFYWFCIKPSVFVYSLSFSYIILKIHLICNLKVSYSGLTTKN